MKKGIMIVLAVAIFLVPVLAIAESTEEPEPDWKMKYLEEKVKNDALRAQNQNLQDTNTVLQQYIDFIQRQKVQAATAGSVNELKTYKDIVAEKEKEAKEKAEKKKGKKKK